MVKIDIIKRIFLLNFPNSKIESIEEFSEGYNNLAFDVKLDIGDFVFKKIKLGEKRRLALKQEKLKILLGKKFKKFPIAKIIKFDYSKENFDFPYIILEKIKGASLKSSYDKILNKGEIFENIGEIYGKLHSFNFSSYGELDSNLKLFKEYSNWFENKCEKIEKTLHKIEIGNNLTKKELNIHKKFYEKNRFILNEESKPCLCHGDASNTNIIVDKVGKKFEIKGLIDFEFVRSSGAVEDLFTGFEFSEQKLYFKESLIKGYTKYSKLPENWEKLVIFYQWIKNINRISNIDTMTWKNLNEIEIVKRKENLKIKTLDSLKKIVADFK
ncbi:aminoglycoside phosphotransferase family protein [Candidatus Woesearchaeota archaeon]|jgi:aminoglycoside phosphotransferase (APT) family kinase protein|nr:aminoglycoside phosphotransferase family protein [Candidatus Woesearchaeota archaeon]